MTVYSDQIKHPLSSKREWFKKGVVITSLAYKQEIDVEIFCSQGCGKDHAKWSPVCPATYRLMPQIEISDIYDDEAVKLQSLFKKDVIGIEKVGNRLKAYVKNPRLDFMSREVLRHEEFEGRVYIGRVPNHYIFTIESIYIDPVILLRKAISILIDKSKRLKYDIINREE